LVFEYHWSVVSCVQEEADRKHPEESAMEQVQKSAHPLQRFPEGTPATVQDLECYRSPSLVGVFPYRDVLFLVAEHL